ncbi:Uncharacterised protein [BD1-7 clade bacterium]|uniref:Lipocalin-like domain-containing protein n=1 Tax=BD1-7 clade bacterium TaxID=2029982 RepID=A0A5S9P3M9_9GAMM|nr:Uncharacterised protein [BD1-7 clade bacterium]CAA0097977.1 Uncharacterised protein [BD1-7 clade bacterium]
MGYLVRAMRVCISSLSPAVLVLTAVLASHAATAQQNTTALQGKWLVKAVDGRYRADLGYWSFSGSELTQAQSGQSLETNAYQLNGNTLSVNGNSVQILRFAGGVMEVQDGARSLIMQKLGASMGIPKTPRAATKPPARPALSQEQCYLAVEHAYADLQQMVEAGRVNVEQGLMPKERLQEAEETAKRMRNDITVKDCLAATTPASLTLYRCLSSADTSLTECAARTSR